MNEFIAVVVAVWVVSGVLHSLLEKTRVPLIGRSLISFMYLLGTLLIVFKWFLAGT